MVIQKNQEFIKLAQDEKSGSILVNPVLENNLLSFVKALPHAIVNTLFRPLPWNIKSPMHAFMLIENILLYLFAALIIVKSKFKILNKNLFYFLILSGLLLLLINGMIVPILGALARYRSIGLLFILLALLNLDFDEKKLLIYKRLKHK